jgi:hypothetical protein
MSGFRSVHACWMVKNARLQSDRKSASLNAGSRSCSRAMPASTADRLVT